MYNLNPQQLKRSVIPNTFVGVDHLCPIMWLIGGFRAVDKLLYPEERTP